MTKRIDLAATPLLPFDPAQFDRCGIRMTRAEFARFLGVSKQAVGDWVRSGKVVLGPDGRLDPRQAVSQLLRTTDPDKLRSRVLAPLLRDTGRLTREVAELRAHLAAMKEETEFHEGSAAEIMAAEGALHRHLRDEWCDLRLLPPQMALAALNTWIDECHQVGGDPNLNIMDCLPADAVAGEAIDRSPQSGDGDGNAG